MFAVPSNDTPPIVLAVCNAVAVPALPEIVVWSPVFVPEEVPECVPDIEDAPAPNVSTEVFATLPVNVTVPVFTVRPVVRVALVTVAALPPIDKPLAVPVRFVATPEDGVPNAPPEYSKVADASGNVNVFSAVVGPVNLVNPFPVPPKFEAMICAKSAVPLKLLP
jgi:hypothetical protein